MAAIRAEALTIEQLFKKGVFEPSRVQRDYQWSSVECAQLLEDLETALQEAGVDPDPSDQQLSQDAVGAAPLAPATNAPNQPAQRLRPSSKRRRSSPQNYFLGPMVLLRRPQAKDAFHIYDGQQRFTTISILMAALRDRLRDDSWQELQEILRTNDDLRRARLQVPTPGGSLARITGTLGGCAWPGRTATRSPADSCMYAAAAHFVEATKSWSDAKVRAFVGYLRTRVYVTVTYVDEPALAHIVFETANTRGLPLSPGDVLKGHIVRVLFEARGAGAADDVATRWERTRRALGARFHHYLRAVDFVAHGRARGAELGDDFLNEFDAPGGAEAAVEFIEQRLPRYLSDYLPIHAHHSVAGDVLTGVDAAFKRLSFLEWKEWEAVAMAFHNRDSSDLARFEHAISRLQQVCYCLHLLGWHARPRSRATALSNAIDQIDNGHDPYAQYLPDGSAGAFYLFDRVRAQARGALRAPLTDDGRIYGPIVNWIESLNGPALPLRLYLNSSVEHVLPRAHGGDWAAVIPDEAERELCKNLLGNMCLLPRHINDRLLNQGPKEKVSAYLTVDETIFKGAHDVAQHAVWDAAAIRARTEALAQKAENALGLL